jgi:capsular polysaccharide biosynthesis protein
MKARTLDGQVKVYSSTDANAVSIAVLPEGTEIEFGAARRTGGKVWVPITLSTGQQAFIPGDARIYVIKQGALMQNSVDLFTEPSKNALVKQQLDRNSKFDILKVEEADGKRWVRIRDTNGNEGFIDGNTRIRVIQQKTKALARKNILSGAMWLVAGLLITFSNSSSASGSGFIILGYGAILFGAFMLISGVMQFFKAPS